MRELAALSHELGRRLGVLVDRSGELTHVFVGDATLLELPPLDTTRRGQGRLKGLRWIATAFGTDEPAARDLTALVRARLDLLVLVSVSDEGTPWSLREAHLLPASEEELASEDASEHHAAAYLVSDPKAPHAARDDLETFLEDLEERFAAATPAARDTGASDGERTIIVAVGTGTKEELDESLAELEELARSAGARVVAQLSQRREKLDVRTLLGKGRVADLAALALQSDAETVVIDHELAPAQVKALEAELGRTKVLDRTQLILDIFAQRARTRAGKLQVETARLRYLAPRLVGQWIGLSRLRGGIGGNRGTGETRLELDRRAIRRRIQHLEDELAKLERQRATNRSRRVRRKLPHVAIVGYTNVGKSTIFNRITDSKVSAEDRAFDTLDPTVRRRRLPGGRFVLFSDTVGFIRDLPEGLLDAFAATLDELRDARLMVHVADASDPRVFERIEQVRALLARLGLDGAPELLVYNKKDRLEDPATFLPLARGKLGHEPLVISALESEETERVVLAVERALEAVLARDEVDAVSGES
ncbi:MAG TPA: GTPase HflX [Planctomycetota bacterium]|nr:GTPase HflX [Planctomycetota bacterium]